MTEQKGKESNVFAILGFIFSFLFALVGLILSIIGLSKSKELKSGKGLSIAGIIISVCNMLLAASLMIFAIGTTTKTVNNQIDKSRELVVENQANHIEDWFEIQRNYSSYENSSDYISPVYEAYLDVYDYTNSEQTLTEEVVKEAYVTNTDDIDFTNSTVRLNGDSVCVKLSVNMGGKVISKTSDGCN